MHPAFSVLLFTTASGAGYGLLFLLGLAAPLGLVPESRWFGFTALAIALGLVTIGLLSSTFHLGHPERAWRAFSQWRSSWLSREGVAALATYVPAGLFGLGWVFLGERGGIWAVAGLLASLGAVVTVISTGMIYASLKTIRQWAQPLVVPVYLAMALATGSLWLAFLLPAFAAAAIWVQLLAIAALVVAWGLKLAYWRAIDGSTGKSTARTATGLGHYGEVRLLDPPHSEENYLLREMGYRIGRKHRDKLRRGALLAGAGLPILLLLLALLGDGRVEIACGLLAAASGSLGAFIERWLFFAEATHKVTLYYGAQAA